MLLTCLEGHEGILDFFKVNSQKHFGCVVNLELSHIHWGPGIHGHGFFVSSQKK